MGFADSMNIAVDLFESAAVAIFAIGSIAALAPCSMRRVAVIGDRVPELGQRVGRTGALERSSPMDHPTSTSDGSTR